MVDKDINLKEFSQSYSAYALFLFIFVLVLLCVPVCGLDRDRTVAQFYHTAWTAKDGAPSQISSLAQTTDGYLWIGSARGLFKFDGVRFELYAPPAGVVLPSQNIYALEATSDGGLWISFRPSGLGFLKDGVLKIFSRPEEIPPTWVYCFAQDSDGRVWAGTHVGLALFDGSRWTEIGADWNFNPERIRTMFVDRDGTLWVATNTTIVFLPRNSKSFQQTGARVGMVPRLAQAADGRIWMAELENSARAVPFPDQKSNSVEPQITADANDLLFDRDGNLWITCSDGIKRVRFPEKLGGETLSSDDVRIETFKASDGLSDNPVHNLFEDHEGNIWINSAKGLDRFRSSALVPVKLPPGHQYSTLLAGERGEVWAANAVEETMVLIRGAEIINQKTPMEISSVYRDANGDIWWGGVGGIWRKSGNSAEFFPHPNPKNAAPEFVWEIFRGAGDGGLWIGLGDVGLVYFKDGVWENRPLPQGLPEQSPSASFQDSSGREWLGYTENRVYMLEGGRVQAFSQKDGINIGRIKVIRGRGSQLWFGGESGLAILKNGRFTTVQTANGDSFGAVSGIVETSDGALWLNEMHGIVRISADEVNQIVENPDYAVSYRLFDFLDGLPGGTQMNYTVSTAIEATDGRLWFATDNGLAWIDPTNISKNIVPPPVSIRSLSTETKIYQPDAPIDLPQGTQSLRIDYTALSFAIPERVRFRYKLEGTGEDWQDAGTRREAFYNNLRPGNYRFQVIAANNDGVWNQTGATLPFSIAPMFYQTNWFLLICLAVAGCLIWLGYKWRIYLVESRLHLQFEDRLAERTHIAQELHDTLLQGVFSASMQLDAAVEQLSDDSPVKPRLKRVQQLTAQIMTEGRNTVKGLHSPSMDNSLSLEKAFAKIKQDLDIREQIDFQVVKAGEPRQLHPVVRDEIYRFGREALINAFRHSKAETIEVEIEYAAKHFRLAISDDGCGIKPEILRSGREGHLGLSGMRECSERIGAKLKIRSQTGSGTEIELIVPHHIAYENYKNNSKGNLGWFGNLFRRRAARSLDNEAKNEK